MNLQDLSRGTVFAAAVVIAIALFSPAAPVGRAGKGGGKGGGGDTSINAKWPSTIEFVDGYQDGGVAAGLKSDGLGPYVDNTATTGDVEAFVGSAAKEGEIILSLAAPPGDNRHVRYDFSTPDPANSGDPSCALPIPDGNSNLFFQRLEVNVSEQFQQGVYNMGLAPDDVAVVTMRTSFRDSTGQLFFLNYGGGERKLCGREAPNDDVVVSLSPPHDPFNSPTWTVTSVTGGSACLERHGGAGGKTKNCGSFKMPFQFTIVPLTATPPSN